MDNKYLIHMGYGYYFLITLEDAAGVKVEELEKVWYPQFKQVYNSYFEKKGEYWFTKNGHEWFPSVKEVEISGAGGYGTGLHKETLPQFSLFTRQFPQFTFGLYLFYWDYNNLTTSFIKGDQLISQSEMNTEALKVGTGIMSIDMKPEVITLSNDITGIFGSKYRDAEDDVHYGYG